MWQGAARKGAMASWAKQLVRLVALRASWVAPVGGEAVEAKVGATATAVVLRAIPARQAEVRGLVRAAVAMAPMPVG